MKWTLLLCARLGPEECIFSSRWRCLHVLILHAFSRWCLPAGSGWTPKGPACLLRRCVNDEQWVVTPLSRCENRFSLLDDKEPHILFLTGSKHPKVDLCLFTLCFGSSHSFSAGTFRRIVSVRQSRVARVRLLTQRCAISSDAPPSRFGFPRCSCTWGQRGGKCAEGVWRDASSSSVNQEPSPATDWQLVKVQAET